MTDEVKINATDAAVSLAEELGIDLSDVAEETEGQGRITKPDVAAYAERARAEIEKALQELDATLEEQSEEPVEPEELEEPAEPPVPAEPEPSNVYRIRCINCGQQSWPVLKTDDGYHCPACGHNWTDREEQAPFRRAQRGEK